MGECEVCGTIGCCKGLHDLYSIFTQLVIKED